MTPIVVDLGGPVADDDLLFGLGREREVGGGSRTTIREGVAQGT